VQLLRTVPERTYDFSARGEFGILEAYGRALRSAQHLIYLENQFLWSSEIAQILIDKLRNPPTEEFRILLLLPAKPDNGADTTRGQLGCLLEADHGAGRLLAVTIHSHNPSSTEALYVHAKVAIVDDRWLTVGSANLNEHSLFNDTEINIATCDPMLARHTRLALWAVRPRPDHSHRWPVAADRRRTGAPSQQRSLADTSAHATARRLPVLTVSRDDDQGGLVRH
jgi:phosphatidylserine/phosphatidylglycerophosphate/cardiolipin synthase-like enzyme